MISNEQKCMFLLAPMWGRIYGGIKDARLFNTFTVTESWGKFALNFYSKNSFSNPSWLNFFKEENKKTPA